MVVVQKIHNQEKGEQDLIAPLSIVLIITCLAKRLPHHVACNSSGLIIKGPREYFPNKITTKKNLYSYYWTSATLLRNQCALAALLTP